jgi:DNA repair exonuclease SbcCD nuclease subunit
MTVRFVHAADLQLGKVCSTIAGDAGAVLRRARFEAARALVELAEARRADFVVVAGDVFDHEDPRSETVRQAFDALRGPIPVYLLPGNHDPCSLVSVYRTPLWAEERPENVHVLATTAPVEPAPGAVLLPCPLASKHVFHDPTRHLEAGFGPSAAIRIGVAHGPVDTVHRRGDRPAANVIPADRAARGALDYLALGDLHSLRTVDARTWYPGTPEPCRFTEDKPGHVLVVDIAAKGAIPEVEPVHLARTTWSSWREAIHTAEDVDGLAAKLEALEPASTLLELELAGDIDEAARPALEAHLARARDRLLHLGLDDAKLHVTLDEAELDALSREGWVGEVVEKLREAPPDPAERARRDRALRMLKSFLAEEVRHG